jgi:hypothetical protein
MWANETELQTLGYTAEEFIGHSITEVRKLLLNIKFLFFLIFIIIFF